jgi:hypothetical protein
VRCPGWLTDRGAAWPWCERCGIRADHHRPISPLADAVRRMIDRGTPVRHPSTERT